MEVSCDSGVFNQSLTCFAWIFYLEKQLTGPAPFAAIVDILQESGQSEV